MLPNHEERLTVSISGTSTCSTDIDPTKMCCSSPRREATRTTCSSSRCINHALPSKSVSFSDDVNVRPVKPLSEHKSKEKRVIWYDTDEFLAIQSEAKLIVRAIRAGASHNVDCTRGFENLHTKNMQKKTEKQKDMAIKSVLSAQKDGASAEELATVCMRHTEEARARALVFAAKDAFDVFESPEVVKVESMPNDEPNKKGRVLQLLGFNGRANRTGKKRVVVGPSA